MGGGYCGALSAIPLPRGLDGLRATLSPKCAPQEQKNWRRSCAAECGSSTRQRSSMSSPQPGQRGAASEYRDTLLLRIVLMSNLLTVFCIGARESANRRLRHRREVPGKKMPPLRAAVEPRPAGGRDVAGWNDATLASRRGRACDAHHVWYDCPTRLRPSGFGGGGYGVTPRRPNRGRSARRARRDRAPRRCRAAGGSSCVPPRRAAAC